MNQSTSKRKFSRLFSASAFVAIFSLVAVFFVPTSAQAANSADFNPGRIISDAVFFHNASMSEGDIQNFLNSKVPNCEPLDSRPQYTSERRACLKDYTETTESRSADSLCRGYSGVANERASTIIKRVADSCGINPRVLLVLMQKETSLVTDTWPLQWKYRLAAGMGCPDTSGCNPAYGGFFKQIYYAAWQFKNYAINPQYFNFRAGGWFNVRYQAANTEAARGISCGTRSIYIENAATAALYNYTPYTPNAAALNNLYGTGDSCSAYGNRNFWRIFTDWFGSTGSFVNESALVKALYQDVHGREPDAGGMSTWVNALRYQGRPVSYVVNGVLASDEYYSARIVQTYREVLGRDPEPAGLAYWLREIQTGRLKVDDLAMIHTASDEFYNIRAGGNPQRFVDLLYQSLLGRSAGQAEQDYWAGRMSQIGRLGVIFSIYGSKESAAKRINVLYQRYFQRDADRAGIETYTPMILSSMGDQGLRGILVNSPEYYQRAVARFPG